MRAPIHHHPIRLRSALRAALLCLVGLGAGCSSSEGGGTGATGTAALGSIAVYNHSSHAGPAVADVVLPLDEGFYSDTPGVRTKGGTVCQVHPMGARFADGSLRYLRVEVPVDTAADELQEIELQASNPQSNGFAKHNSISGDIGVQARLRAGSTTLAFPPAVRIEAGPVSETWRSRVRVGSTMIWGELTVTLYSNLPHARFTLQWGNSDPSQSDLQTDPGEVELQLRGARVEYELASKVLGKSTKDGYEAALLFPGGMLGDGQSQFLEGRLVYDGSSPPRLFAISKEWPRRKVFGPFGTVMPEIPVDVSAFVQMVQKDSGVHQDHPWERAVHGCNPEPSSTGYQSDFGTIVMRPDLVLGDPRRLPSIQRSIYQEACRSTHVREVDVSPVTMANHPNMLTQTGRAKYVNSRSDLLGKQRGWISSYMKSPDGQRWQGHDFEHLSVNYLAAYALVTGNRFAREEIDHHVTLYLSGYTYNSGSPNDGLTPARKFGRSTLAAVWIWLVSGDQRVATRVTNRAEALRGELTEPRSAKIQAIPSFAPRWNGRDNYWFVWEEGNAVTGLAAVYHNFGSIEARDMGLLVGKSVTMHGFGQRSDGTWRACYQAPYAFGDDSVYFATKDPEFDKNAAGGGITVWGSPALVFVAAMHPEPTVKNQALQILTGIYGPGVDPMSEKLQWIAAAPDAAGLIGYSSGN